MCSLPICIVIRFSMEFVMGSYLLRSLNEDVNQLKSNPGKKKM